MEFTAEEGKQPHNNCSTLILPALSIGNVGQLAVDLLVSSLGADKVGYLDDPYVLPCVGNDAYGPEAQGDLAVALEEILIVSSLDSGKRPRCDVTSSQIHYISTANADGMDEKCEKLGWKKLEQFVPSQKGWQYLDSQSAEGSAEDDSFSLEDELTDEDYFPSMPFASLFSTFKAKGLKVTCIFCFCSEGDNIPDAFLLAEAVHTFLGIHVRVSPPLDIVHRRGFRDRSNPDAVKFHIPNTSHHVHKCHYEDGYQGDGFALGDGCRKGSSKCNPSRYMSGHCGGTTRVAVLFGGLFAGATLVLVVVLVYCFLKRSSLALETRRSQKRLLSANGGSFAIPLFTYKELEKATKGFSEKERLGNGAFGTVYAGKLHGNQWVAVKRIRHIDTYGIEQVMNEIKLLSSVDHPNLVRLMGCCIEKGEPILVYEYMPNGTLSQHLQRERGEGLSWTQRITLAAETAHALAYLHSAINPPIYHRDVKSSNILLDYGFNSKVADFGLSRIVLTESSHISTVPQGTPGYLDPQYHQNFHLSDKSDVYSFGVVLVEIITALKVVDFLRKKSEINLASLAINRIGSGCVDEIIDPFLEADKYPRVRMTVHRVAELAFRCLAFDRDARPTMLEVAEELDFIRDTIQDKQPQVDNNQNIFTLPEEGNCSVLCAGDEEDDAKFRRRSTDSVKQSRRNSTGSRRIMIQSPLMDELKAVILDKMDTASPVSVQDPWVSAQSSPSTSSLLENVIE